MKCLYCLETFEDLTADHVFPRSWYPETTPENEEKWQVPCCLKCNQRLSKIEQELMTRVGMCLDPKHPASLGIPQKVLRSLKPEYARGKRDREKRRKKRKRFLDGLVNPTQLPLSSCYPGFGPKSDRPLGKQKGILIPVDLLEKFTEKIVRGITFIDHEEYIDNEHTIEIHVQHENDAAILIDMVNQHGKKYYQGPGIEIEAAFAHDDSQSALFDIKIWQQFRIYASITS